MIRHIVFFTAKTSEDRDRIKSGLALLTKIPHALRFEIGENLKTDQLGSAIDFVVYGEFADESALADFKAHPAYQASIAVVRPLREIRIAADYDTELAVIQPIEPGA